jgi:hypothetical protein
VEVQPTQSPEQLNPFTAATRRKLLTTKPDVYGFVRCADPGLFDCRTGASEIELVFHLLDAIEKALPQVNVKLVKGKERLEVEHEGQTLTFKLVEQCTRTEYMVRDKYYKGWEGSPSENLVESGISFGGAGPRIVWEINKRKGETRWTSRHYRRR